MKQQATYITDIKYMQNIHTDKPKSKKIFVQENVSPIFFLNIYNIKNKINK